MGISYQSFPYKIQDVKVINLPNFGNKAKNQTIFMKATYFDHQSKFKPISLPDSMFGPDSIESNSIIFLNSKNNKFYKNSSGGQITIEFWIGNQQKPAFMVTFDPFFHLMAEISNEDVKSEGYEDKFCKDLIEKNPQNDVVWAKTMKEFHNSVQASNQELSTFIKSLDFSSPKNLSRFNLGQKFDDTARQNLDSNDDGMDTTSDVSGSNNNLQIPT